jgi:DNA polymerase-3 subunit alpha
VDDKGSVLYGLGAIKGLGEGPIEAIITARECGEFKNIFDFCTRVDGRKVNKRALEAMIRGGAMDQIGPEGDISYRRAVMLACMDEAVKLAEQHIRNQVSGMGDLFGDSIVDSAPEISYLAFDDVKSLSVKDRLNGEKDTLGLYLTGHPIDEYESELKKMFPHRIANLRSGKDSLTISGMIVAMRILKNKRGDNFAFLTLDDKSGRIEISVWAEKFNAYRDILVKDALLVIKGVISEDDFTGGLKMVAESIQSIYQARCSKLLCLELLVSEGNTDWVDKFRSTINRYRNGNCSVFVNYEQEHARCALKLGSDWKVQPQDGLLIALREQFGEKSVILRYD